MGERPFCEAPTCDLPSSVVVNGTPFCMEHAVALCAEVFDEIEQGRAATDADDEADHLRGRSELSHPTCNRAPLLPHPTEAAS